MFSINRHVGRLVEVRIASPVRDDEMATIAAQTFSVIGSIQGHFVAVMDLRQARLFSQQVADSFIHILTDNNPLLERSAFLIGGESAVFSLQVERAIVTARKSVRRAFRDPADLETWVGETLNTVEKERLHQFLEEGRES